MANKRHKYRLAMLDDITLREVFHIRMSWLGVVSVITITLLALIVLLSILIVYTPIRNILPGYSESLRQQLIQESARVDSLQSSLTIQRQYLDVIKQLTAGDIQSDSVQSLDSLQRVEQVRILAEGRHEVTDAFMAQYEQKERDRMLLFDAPVSQSIQQLYRPVRGAVMVSARPDLHLYATSIATAKNESVLAVMRGRIVHVQRAEDNSFTVVLQQAQYLTIYRGVTKVLKAQGASVEAGEAIGVMGGERNIEIELWDAGKFVNIEEVIAW